MSVTNVLEGVLYYMYVTYNETIVAWNWPLFFLFFNLVLLVALRGKLTVILVNSYLDDGMCFLLSLETSLHLQDSFYVTRKQPGPVTYSLICGVVQQTIEQPAKIHRNVFLYLSWKGILHRRKDDGDCYNHS